MKRGILVASQTAIVHASKALSCGWSLHQSVVNRGCSSAEKRSIAPSHASGWCGCLRTTSRMGKNVLNSSGIASSLVLAEPSPVWPPNRVDTSYEVALHETAGLPHVRTLADLLS